ncbi:CLUMA_CG007574, isoform A [Clunio marinus]|uniref:CLUMA_CG007574, isoform A n=1 Tax=Clunio marinus TaxID=568069 RepID=A0A1J1I2Q7_9DIPT|nr:CLUMA_CG007574, isoform A [Clunio marinus]
MKVHIISVPLKAAENSCGRSLNKRYCPADHLRSDAIDVKTIKHEKRIKKPTFHSTEAQKPWTDYSFEFGFVWRMEIKALFEKIFSKKITLTKIPKKSVSFFFRSTIWEVERKMKEEELKTTKSLTMSSKSLISMQAVLTTKVDFDQIMTSSFV